MLLKSFLSQLHNFSNVFKFKLSRMSEIKFLSTVPKILLTALLINLLNTLMSDLFGHVASQAYKITARLYDFMKFTEINSDYAALDLPFIVLKHL